jgi:pimeloyl-ACP methyl ester carboxylesterase
VALHSPTDAARCGVTLVLVHGAWHGSWCWQRLVPRLEQRGIAVRVVDLPSVGAPAVSAADLSADAAAVRAVIETAAAPVVLCGHSYGGMVISQAATALRKVARLVYLCAFMPLEGQSLVAIGGGKLAPWIQQLADGRTLPDLNRAAELFFGDCDAATQSWAVKQLRPQPAAPFTEAVTQPAWRAIASTYIVCTQDRALPAELQRLFAGQASDVRELVASHSPFLSQPERLAELLAGCIPPSA